MSQTSRQVKNLKISIEAHEVLKTYCEKKGVKIYRFLENLIITTCSETQTSKTDVFKKKESKDIYGED
jgi:hypothetical protein